MGTFESYGRKFLEVKQELARQYAEYGERFAALQAVSSNESLNDDFQAPKSKVQVLVNVHGSLKNNGISLIVVRLNFA